MALKELQQKIGVKADGVFGPVTLKAAAVYFKLNKYEAAHFFGQCAHESGNFTKFEENLNYSARRLLQLFNKYFKQTYVDVLWYAGNPERIGNRVYADRMGNGNEASGDGYKYRGFGPLMLTGKENVAELAKEVNDPTLLACPEMIATKYAFESALFFFYKNKLFQICNSSVSQKVMADVTKRVNGGYNGLEDRIKYTLKYFRWLNV